MNSSTAVTAVADRLKTFGQLSCTSMVHMDLKEFGFADREDSYF